jgi:hypothetical protein|tara:strand:+ start:106 stop:459 length:354 start_codon:yes stop_codon:yes gene_type:complete
MIATSQVLGIIIAHWIGDFLLQNEKMALGKSSSNKLLTIHVAIWTTTMAVITIPLGLPVVWVLLMGVLHWIQDYITSRLNSYYAKIKNNEMFWNMIGTDQMLHYIIMFLSLHLWTRI